MTHGVTGRHPAQALRRCATTPEDSLSASLPENEGMSATRTRYSIVTSIRRSAAMTHGVTDRHPAHALRRCATMPKESLSAPGERGDVRSADTILHSNPIRRSAAMTHEVTGRHAHTLRRCATSHSLPSFRRARGMSAARTRFQLTPDRVRGRATNAACTATRCR